MLQSNSLGEMRAPLRPPLAQSGGMSAAHGRLDETAATAAAIVGLEASTTLGPACVAAVLGLAARMDGLSPEVAQTASGPLRVAHVRLAARARVDGVERAPRRLEAGEARVVLRLSPDRRARAAAARLLGDGGIELAGPGGAAQLLGEAVRDGALPVSAAAVSDALRLVVGGARAAQAFDRAVAGLETPARAAGFAVPFGGGAPWIEGPSLDLATTLARRARRLSRLAPAATERWRDAVACVAGAETAVRPGATALTRAAAALLFDRAARSGWPAPRPPAGAVGAVAAAARQLVWTPSPALRRLEADVARLSRELTPHRMALAAQILAAEAMRDRAAAAVRRAALWASWRAAVSASGAKATKP